MWCCLNEYMYECMTKYPYQGMVCCLLLSSLYILCPHFLLLQITTLVKDYGLQSLVQLTSPWPIFWYWMHRVHLKGGILSI